MSNLLPQTEKKKILGMYRKRFLALVFFSAAFILLSGAVLLFPAYIVLKDTASSLTEKRDQLKKDETAALQGALAKTISDINSRLAIFPDVVTASPIIATFVRPVLETKTAAINITNMGYATGEGGAITVQISGIAGNRSSLLSFADALKATKGFKNVTVPISSFIKDSNVTFTIGAVLDQKL
ncbi:MAG: hypothetical protein KA052_00305 [Candidatus Pacebacteria bacterium]|nr:hypothetical protein [Candidatus Paceibacterota bacterium]